MVGQGALAVECRRDDAVVRDLVTPIDDDELHRSLDAERAFLRELGGGCTMPCGALATVAPDGSVSLDALLASEDGARVLRTVTGDADPERAGVAAARRILDDLGGADLLTDGAAS